MSEVILQLLLGAGASLVAGSTVAALQPLIRKLFGREAPPTKPFSERLSELTESLTRASREVDSVLSEIAAVARAREASVKKLEIDLQALEGQEEQLKGRIEALQNTPLPVAEHFAALIASGEKRSAKRDYLLFGAGVVVSTILSIIIQLGL